MTDQKSQSDQVQLQKSLSLLGLLTGVWVALNSCITEMPQPCVTESLLRAERVKPLLQLTFLPEHLQKPGTFGYCNF